MAAELPPVAIASELGSGLVSVFGTDLVAVYLYGSAVAGGFDPGVSDVDLLVVVERDLDPHAVEGVRKLHGRVAREHPAWNDRLELVYVTREALRGFRNGGSLGVISPGEPFHIRDGLELWLQNLYLVRSTGLALFGPEPAALIPPIASSEFRGAVVRYGAEVAGRNLRDATPGGRAYAVLTLCRALRTVETGLPCSKQDGAEWVRARMPELAALIDEAERCRLSGGKIGLADDWSVGAVEDLVATLARAVRRAAEAKTSRERRGRSGRSS